MGLSPANHPAGRLSRGRRARSTGDVSGPASANTKDPDEPAFQWRGGEEAVVYFCAATSLIGLGVLLRSLILNWIVGPFYVVAFVWAAVVVLGRRSGRRP